MKLLRFRRLRLRPAHEPLLVLAVAVAAPCLTLALLGWQARPGRFPEPPVGAAHPAALVSPREDRELSPWRWLRLATDAPLAFAASVDFCSDHSAAPLPNCTNVLLAQRTCHLLDSLTGGGRRGD